MSSTRRKLLVTILGAGIASSPGLAQDASYAPIVTPSEFTSAITNPFFKMPVGRHLSYRKDSDEGRETTETVVIAETRMIMGVSTVALFDRVSLDGELIEETKNFVAQNAATGDVWFFGEMVDNYEDGRLLDHQGTWIAGEYGALPGILVKGQPHPGDTYRNQFYRDQAEDMSKVESIGQRVEVKGRVYEDCVHTTGWTRLEPDLHEDKFYCRDVGANVLTIDRESGAREELLSVTEPR